MTNGHDAHHAEDPDALFETAVHDAHHAEDPDALFESAVHDAHHAEDPDALVEASVEALKEHGERVTAARRRMLAVLAARHDHLTADQVAAEVNHDGVHRATVYRSLEAFAEAGIVTHRQLPGGATAYHLATPNHLHGHCGSCGRVIALPSDVFDDAVDRLRRLQGFTFEPNRSSLIGTCADCRARRGKPDRGPA